LGLLNVITPVTPVVSPASACTTSGRKKDSGMPKTNIPFSLQRGSLYYYTSAGLQVLLTHVKLLHNRSRKGVCPSVGLLSLESIAVERIWGK